MIQKCDFVEAQNTKKNMEELLFIKFKMAALIKMADSN
jgi:hypothetical protein